MIEHPIPQNVTSYQFHLVGDMTMKQFLELAGGVVGAWIFWSLNLPGILRWPLSIFAALMGIALAFFPFEERPLDQWIIAFFRSIYRPTIFIWKRAERSDIFELHPKKTNHDSPIEAISKAPTASFQTLLEAYELQELEQTTPDPLETERRAREGRLFDLFTSVTAPPGSFSPTVVAKKLAAPPRPASSRQTIHPLAPPDDPSAILRGEITMNLRIPQTKSVSFTAVPPATQGSPPASQRTALAPQVVESGTLPTATLASTSAPSGGAAFATANPHLPMPGLPDYPNILSGMVLTPAGALIENAIIEIRDSTGLPVRAVKTNKLGQFTIATPLPNGTYELIVEADDTSFDILRVEAKGEIIPPIEIKAKLSPEVMKN